MRLEAKHFFSLAVVSISAEPISVFCGVNARRLDGWSGAYSNITVCGYGYRSKKRTIKSTYVVKAKNISLADIARLY
jgi:hypothetical protein